jgi:hypothetical protein
MKTVAFIGSSYFQISDQWNENYFKFLHPEKLGLLSDKLLKKLHKPKNHEFYPSYRGPSIVSHWANKHPDIQVINSSRGGSGPLEYPIRVKYIQQIRGYDPDIYVFDMVNGLRVPWSTKDVHWEQAIPFNVHYHGKIHEEKFFHDDMIIKQNFANMRDILLRDHLNKWQVFWFGKDVEPIRKLVAMYCRKDRALSEQSKYVALEYTMRYLESQGKKVYIFNHNHYSKEQTSEYLVSKEIRPQSFIEYCLAGLFGDDVLSKCQNRKEIMSLWRKHGTIDGDHVKDELKEEYSNYLDPILDV